MVYFIQLEEGGPIKIGHTFQLRSRFIALKGEYKSPIKVLGVMDGGLIVEKLLHSEFKEHSVRYRSERDKEWFLPHETLLGFIERNTQPWDGKKDRRDRIPYIMSVGMTGAWKRWIEEESRPYMGEDSTWDEGVARFLRLAIINYAERTGCDLPAPETEFRVRFDKNQSLAEG